MINKIFHTKYSFSFIVHRWRFFRLHTNNLSLLKHNSKGFELLYQQYSIKSETERHLESQEVTPNASITVFFPDNGHIIVILTQEGNQIGIIFKILRLMRWTGKTYVAIGISRKSLYFFLGKPLEELQKASNHWIMKKKEVCF